MLRSLKIDTVLFAIGYLLAVGSAALAQQQPTPPDRWHSLQTKDLHVIGNAGETDLRGTAARMLEFRDALSHLFPQASLTRRIPLRVVVFRDQASYSPFKPKRTGKTIDDGVLGYFLAGEGANYITLAPGKGGAADGNTARHEYFHFFTSINFPGRRLPPWLNEGLAEYFETIRLSPARDTIILGAPLDDHLRLIRRNGLQPLAEFFASDEAAIHATGGAARELFYAQSWLVVHYLLQTERIKIADLREKVTALASADGISGKSFENVFGISYPDLESDLKRYIAQRSLPLKNEPVQRPIAVFTPPVATAMTEAAALAYRGDLLLYSGDSVSAEGYLRRSLALDPSSSLANGSLGLALLEQKKYAEAVGYLERAVSAGANSHLVLFSYAYALHLGSADEKGRVEDLPAAITAKMREALQKAIEAEPTFAQSYQLLAFTYFVNDEKLDEAARLLRQALQIRPDEPEYELLLAQILSRQQKYAEARQLAERVSKSRAASPAGRSEADEILGAIAELDKTNTEKTPLQLQTDLTLINFVPAQLVFLKRSWLAEADIPRIEEERVLNNLNRLLIRPAPGEIQLVGRIRGVSCTPAGEITYNVAAADGTALRLTSKGFQDLRMIVLTEGERSFEVGCEARLDKQLTVLNIRPAAAPGRGVLTAISFVPDNFRLKTADELAAARTVVVDDDTYRRAEGGKYVSGGPEFEKRGAREQSISRSLRIPQKGETRVIGMVEKVDCSAGTAVLFRVRTSSGNQMTFTASSTQLKIGWFTVASTQLSLSCGSGPLKATAVLTFRQSSGAPADADGELRAIEFVPDGFSL